MNITTGVIAKAQKTVLYGPEGIGKSSIAARFPEPLFIDTEGSTNNMDVARMDKPSSWEFLHQQVEYVIQNRPCKTLIIDTIDWAERLGVEFITSRSNKKSITHFGYGEGFIQLEEEFGKFLNKLTDVVEAGIHVVLTAHAKIVRFEQPDEIGAYDRWELKLGNKTTAKTSSLVKEWADIVLFMNYKTFSVATDDKGTKFKGQGGERKFYATHHPAWDAKNRHNLPDEFPMDYGQIAHIFETEQVQATPVQQQPVTSVPPVAQQPTTQPVADPVQPTQPTVEQQPPAQTVNTVNVEGETVQLDPAIPQSLRDLMVQHGVTEQEIQTIVGQRGYYPENTPITNYDPSFIDGVLVGAWEQVHGMIKEFRESLPF